MTELYRNEHFIVSRPEQGIIRIDRTEEPFESTTQMEASMEGVNAKLDELGRPGHRLLVDTRNAKPRNDPDFERAFDVQRKRMLSGFERRVVLVRSEAGRLQVDRHARQDGLDTVGYTDEAQALAAVKQ